MKAGKIYKNSSFSYQTLFSILYPLL